MPYSPRALLPPRTRNVGICAVSDSADRQDEAVSKSGDRSVSQASLPVRVRPGASRNRVGGSHDGPYGTAVVVMVTARPVAGKATDAVLIAVAKALGVRRSAVSVRAGGTSRDKLLTITDPPPDFAQRVATLCDGTG